jgi:hypothetical protein
MSDPKPLPPFVPPELEKEYEWEASLDAYIERWGKAVRKFIEEKGYTRQDGGKPSR